MKRTLVFSLLRVRTHETLRFSRFANSASRILPSSASSAPVHGRARTRARSAGLILYGLVSAIWRACR